MFFNNVPVSRSKDPEFNFQKFGSTVHVHHFIIFLSVVLESVYPVEHFMVHVPVSVHCPGELRYSFGHIHPEKEEVSDLNHRGEGGICARQ